MDTGEEEEEEEQEEGGNKRKKKRRIKLNFYSATTTDARETKKPLCGRETVPVSLGCTDRHYTPGE